jgi:hypothetical protein
VGVLGPDFSHRLLGVYFCGAAAGLAHEKQVSGQQEFWGLIFHMDFRKLISKVLLPALF